MVQPSAAALDTLASPGHLLDGHPLPPTTRPAGRVGPLGTDRKSICSLWAWGGHALLMISLPSPMWTCQVPASPCG